MQRPLTTTNNPKQRFIAELLATGATIKEAASVAGVKASYIEVLMKGSLFPMEIDRARDRLIRDRLQLFGKSIAEELPANIEVLKEIRDNKEAKHSDRLKAVEILIDRIVPRPKQVGTEAVESQVRIVLSDDRAKHARAAIEEEAIETTAVHVEGTDTEEE